MGNKKKKANKPSADSADSSQVTLETIAPGDGTSMPKSGDAVTVHYVGTLASDGTMFDSSRAKKAPFTFKLNGGGVIKGWDIGVAQMSLGQRSNLHIAAEVAYGSAGAEDKANASGTGVIPPHAALVFDVELLDLNFHITLGRYMSTLDEWVVSKLTAYDSDDGVRTPLEAKHGGRDGYVAHLKGAVAKKYEAERTKRAASVGVDVARLPTASEAPRPKIMQPPRAVDTAAAGVAAASISDRTPTTAVSSAEASRAVAEEAAKAEAAKAAEEEAAKEGSTLHFDQRFSSFKVEPNDESESVSAAFPRSLHNAAELFSHLGHSEQARRLHECVTRALSTLKAGPDGRSAQRLGRACVCWGCGHVGLPRNSAQCADKGAKPAGVCAGCGDDAQTNFVRCMRDGKSIVPWIEAPPLTPEQVAKADEAAKAADAAEVS